LPSLSRTTYKNSLVAGACIANRCRRAHRRRRPLTRVEAKHGNTQPHICFLVKSSI
jgi:hypothetical protein